MNKILYILLITITILNGCTKYKPFKNKTTFKPFPYTTIEITATGISDVYNVSSDVKEPSCIIKIIHTENVPLRIELWTGRYRARDKKVKTIELEKAQTIEFETVPADTGTIDIYYVRSFTRMECYSTNNGKIIHKSYNYLYTDDEEYNKGDI